MYNKKYTNTPKRYKILACAYACYSESRSGWSGGEFILGWEMACQLGKFADVWILTNGWDRDEVEHLLQKYPQPSLRFVYVKLPKFLSFLEKYQGGIQIYVYLWQIKSFFAAKKLHKQIHFDVFHHITYANDWMASFIGALLSIPYIRGPGGGAHRVPRSFIKECGAKERALDAFRSVGQWFYRRDPFFIIGQNRARALLLCNKEAFNSLPKKWQKKAYYFPVNGISQQELNFLPAQQLSEKQDFLVFSAGRLIKLKNFKLAIRVFKVFNDKFSNSKFFIAGEGPELQNLKDLAKSLGLENKVIFGGFLSHKDLLSKMASCDAFLFTSLRDGGGAVVVEAMAVAKPVVCFDNAGPGFYIDEKCGIKIKPEYPEKAIKEMADALGRLYCDPNLKNKLGAAAKEKAIKEYSWDNLGKYLFSIYEKNF